MIKCKNTRMGNYMRIDIRKVLLAIACVAVLISIGIIIGININFNRVSPKLQAVDGRSWTMETGYEGHMINNNFWSFIEKSYIIVGTPPDCQFYKIVQEIPRNDYDKERFYIDYDDKMFYHDADGNAISTLAIDVSEFQSDINWAAVKNAGVDVVMIRVGYRGYGSGRIVEDAMFKKHIEGALAENLRVGVYFFTQGINSEEGIEEAEFVLDCIRGYNISCPVAIDTEAIYAEDARTNELDNTARTDVVTGFCDTIKEAGYTPMIYTNRNWLVQCLDMTRLGGYKIWYAHYTNQPDLPYEYTGWQYTDTGVLDGVNENVDLNVWME